MEDRISEILDNILGLLLLEGSYEIKEEEENFVVEISIADAGRLIGFKGESLSALQLLVNQILSRSNQDQFTRVVIDVAGWRKSKEEELKTRVIEWANQVKESGQALELEPMPSWQRRVIHLEIEKIAGVTSESVGEGQERHLVIKPEDGKTQKDSVKSENQAG